MVILPFASAFAFTRQWYPAALPALRSRFADFAGRIAAVGQRGAVRVGWDGEDID
jgi:hypothetical protein